MITSTTILGIFWLNASNYTRERVDGEFAVAIDTFRQQLDSRELQLINSAELLTSDFGFKQAVATRDAATINSVLFNHGNRVSADLMFLVGLDGLTTAATHAQLPAGEHFPFTRLVSETARTGGALSFVQLDDSLYQLVIVPVRAPTPIAFAGVGFELDESVVNELKSLTGLDVTVRLPDTDRQITTLDPSDVRSALGADDEVSDWFGVPFSGASSFVSQSLALEGESGQTGQVVLTANLADAAEEFEELRDEIFIISIIILGLAISGSAILANNISNPLKNLVRAAMAMAQGNYDQDIDPRNRTEEVRTLFQAFNEMSHDIKAREERIVWQAEHDATTGLLTRNTLITIADEQVESNSVPFILAQLSVPGISNTADAFGPEVGDQYLKRISERLQEYLGETANCARVGTQEIAWIQPIHGDIPEMCRLLATELQRPLSVADLNLKPHVILGYARYPLHGNSGNDLYRRSSIALDRAIQEQMSIREYTEGEDEEHLTRLRIINDLKDALEVDDGQLYMVYQPKMNLSNGRVEKMEALIRWTHPEDGFVSPELFIALAEQSNLIIQLTDWVISTVIKQAAAWYSNFPDLQIAINVSSQDIERPELLPNVRALLSEHALPHHVVAFEMTERDMMSDADTAIELMSKFQADGFDLSVDDYGIGQSSLSRLKQMPISEIKIDKLFITHLDESESDQVIVRSTIELGHSFGLRVIAEGVENQTSQDLLQAFGCDYIQGYFLSRPIEADKVESWTRQFNNRPKLVKL